MNLVHQASHGQLFESRWLNRWIGRLFVGWPVLVSLAAYREEHYEHHVKLWKRGEDPKVDRLVAFGLVEADSRRLPFVWKHVVSPMTLRHAPRNIVGAVTGAGEHLGRIVFVGVLAVAIVLLGLESEFLVYWLLPYVSTFQVMRYWAEMAEHSGLESDRPWSATRNWTAALPIRWLLAPHSDHWHLVHHLCSTVPHYRLAAAHRVLMRIPEYADEGHHCDGLFFAHRPDAPSVIGDVMHPAGIDDYRPTRAGLGATLTARLHDGEEVDEETAVGVQAYFESLRAAPSRPVDESAHDPELERA
jgi:fatty acid desaturase